MKKISIIIPAYNEEASIWQLLSSIDAIDYPRNLYEVIVVNDGSHDATASIVRTHPGVRLVDLPRNVGRYACRQRGAEAASFPHLLFVDAHSQVDPNVLRVLDQSDAKAINGRVEDAEPLGAFQTFYRAIRRLLFPKFYRQPIPFYLTPENFDSEPKGTTVFYIEKDVLFSVYQDLADVEMGRDSSDDTKLLRAIVARTPILHHPEVKTKYFSRSSIRASIKHLYERGPKFVDYYLNPSLRNFWLVIALPLLGLFTGVAGIILLPVSLFAKIAGAAGVNIAAALILARSAREFLVILWVMPVSIAVFYGGILRGLYLKLLKSGKGPQATRSQ